jgi:hypothetical protein
MMWAIAIITESVGVPVTQKRRSPKWRRRTGLVRVSEWPCARLLLRRGDDPDIVRQSAGDPLQDLQPRGVHAVIVGEEDAHVGRAMLSGRPVWQAATETIGAMLVVPTKLTRRK